MAEKGPSETTTTTTTTKTEALPETTPQEQVDDDIREEETNQELTPLFDEETVHNEDELTGEEESGEEEGKSSEEEKSSETEKAAASQPKDEKAKTEEKSEETEKPPPGFVPKGALDEERTKRKESSSALKETSDKLNALRQEFNEYKRGDTKEEAPQGEKFKTLSEEEFEELLKEDPTEAIKYQRKLNQHERVQEQVEKTATQNESIVNSVIERVTKAVPGIYDEDNPISGQLTEFAVNNGMDKASLALLTNPETMFLPAGEDTPVLLGDGVAGFVEMVYKLHQGATDNNPESLRAEIRTEVEKELRESITKELMSKFKQTDSTEEHQNLGEAPGSGDIPDFNRDLTEREYAKLTPSQQEKYLAGQE